jgi:hypothetical protein
MFRRKLDIRPGDILFVRPQPNDIHPEGQCAVIESAGTVYNSSANVGKGFSGSLYIKNLFVLSLGIGRAYLHEELAKPDGKYVLLARIGNVQEAKRICQAWAKSDADSLQLPLAVVR